MENIYEKINRIIKKTIINVLKINGINESIVFFI